MTTVSRIPTSRLMSRRHLSTLPYRIRAPLSRLQAAKTLSAERLAGALGHGEALEAAPAEPDYVRMALTSRVYEMISETPLQHVSGLSERLGANVHFKREDLNPAFSFYIRGAYAKLASLKQQGCSGVITVSVGSRGLALACAAQRLSLPVTIVMPDIVPEGRRQHMARKGANLVVTGSTLIEAKAEAARRLAEDPGLTMLQPHDDPLIIAGQATAGMEILRQYGSVLSARQRRALDSSLPAAPAARPALDAIFLPVGGGSLLAGVAAAVKQIAPAVKIIGVEPEGVDVLRQSLMSGSRVTIAEPGVDGIWVPQLGEEVYRLCDTLVDDVVRVSDDEICDAIRDCFDDTRAMLEPAGATSIAGLKKWALRNDGPVDGDEARPRRNYVAVASDACNIEFDFLGRVQAGGASIVSR